jgi:GT2 family glycosyltransferase
MFSILQDKRRYAMDISIIIINYDLYEETISCISSICKNFKGDDRPEVIVVDIYSSDRKIEDLPQIYPKVMYHFLSENLGYARANNLGAELFREEEATTDP